MKAILAMSKNRCIGKEGKLPWKYSDDFKWFKEFTMGHTLIVGRKTFEGLPQLKHRTIWVLSKTMGDTALAICSSSVVYHSTSNIDIIPKDGIIAGGKSIYELFLPKITEFYVTCIDKNYEGDTFMEPFEHLFSKSQIVKEFDFGKVIKYEK
jgi:dihydrofolate reductase